MLRKERQTPSEPATIRTPLTYEVLSNPSDKDNPRIKYSFGSNLLGEPYTFEITQPGDHDPIPAVLITDKKGERKPYIELKGNITTMRLFENDFPVEIHGSVDDVWMDGSRVTVHGSIKEGSTFRDSILTVRGNAEQIFADGNSHVHVHGDVAGTVQTFQSARVEIGNNIARAIAHESSTITAGGDIQEAQTTQSGHIIAMGRVAYGQIAYSGGSIQAGEGFGHLNEDYLDDLSYNEN